MRLESKADSLHNYELIKHHISTELSLYTQESRNVEIKKIAQM